jgi:hypothetical protein
MLMFVKCSSPPLEGSLVNCVVLPRGLAEWASTYPNDEVCECFLDVNTPGHECACFEQMARAAFVGNE